ncbi:MAG: hypothetical protein AB8B72_02925 [Crocinitomicaceae bacterium]
MASDANVTVEEIEKLRTTGISTYYINKPGSFASANRLAIKKFINSTFPDNDIVKMQRIEYGIPVELLITKNLEIVNEKETIKSYEFITKPIGTPQ